MFIFEIVVSALTSGAFVFLLVNSLHMEPTEHGWDSAGAFPTILSGIVLICSVIWFVDTLVTHTKSEKETSAQQKPEAQVVKKGRLPISEDGKRLMIVVILTVLYVLVLMPWTGFIIATFLFLFVSITLFYKKWNVALIVAVVMSSLLYVLFQYGLHLPMPR